MADAEVRIVELRIPVTVRHYDLGYGASGRAGGMRHIAYAETPDAAVAAWIDWANGQWFGKAPDE